LLPARSARGARRLPSSSLSPHVGRPSYSRAIRAGGAQPAAARDGPLPIRCPIDRYRYADRDWAAIARDYAANALTVDDLCAAHRITRTAFYNFARRENLPLRVPMKDGVKRRRIREEDLAQRLLNALDRKMRAFEARLAQGHDAAPSAADAERDARTLNTLVRLFDRLQAAAKDPEPAKAARGRARPPAQPVRAGKDMDDADFLRRDLAQRLERLRRVAD
jgi:hypothetical protein